LIKFYPFLVAVKHLIKFPLPSFAKEGAAAAAGVLWNFTLCGEAA